MERLALVVAVLGCNGGASHAPPPAPIAKTKPAVTRPVVALTDECLVGP